MISGEKNNSGEKIEFAGGQSLQVESTELTICQLAWLQLLPASITLRIRTFTITLSYQKFLIYIFCIVSSTDGHDLQKTVRNYSLCITEISYLLNRISFDY